MTAEETINALKIIQEAIEWDLPYECAAIVNAIELLKRRIPERPTIERSSAGVGLGFCPKCKEIVRSAYCERCGQAIDWSEGK